MPIDALAFDYDGTIADEGVVAGATLEALGRARASGRALLLVTGRRLDDLRQIFPAVDHLFEAVVAENGALLWRPERGDARPLAEPPPPAFAPTLRRRGVEPLAFGQVIVATLTTNEPKVRAAIGELGLDWRIILNRSSLMCLPPGVDKGSGLVAACGALGRSPRTVLGAGDAENDEALLAACGVGVAVANALPTLKAAADIVTRSPSGAGIVELIDRLLSGDLATAQAGVQPS